jgi:alpha-glucosidase (family GH31 glycosyl hydrolase)
MQGDFKFDPTKGPNVPAMMTNLTQTFNIPQVMVSTWPFVATGSTTFSTFGEKEWVFTNEGTATPIYWCVGSGDIVDCGSW